MNDDSKPMRADQITEGRLRLYGVVTPEYETCAVGDYEPPEWGRDYRLVYARTAKRAVILTWKAWRRMNWRARTGGRFSRLPYRASLCSEWLRDTELDELPPWKGLKAEVVPTEEWIETNFPIPEGVAS